MAKLGFAAVLALVGVASGHFLRTAPATKHDDLEEMEGTIETLVTKDDDPATRKAVEQLNKLMVKTLLPSRARGQKNDQAMINMKADDVKKCSLNAQVKRDMNVGEKVTMAKQHKDNYNKNAGAHGECLFVNDAKNMVKNARCANKQGVMQSAQEIEKNCKCAPKVQTFTSPAVDCTGAPPIPRELVECCDALAEVKEHEQKCMQAKNEVEYAARQHEIIMSKLCGEYDKCFTATSKAFSDTEARVKASENKRKWQRLHHIQCLVDQFETGKVSEEQVKACKDEKHEKGQGIKYPKAPVKETCQVKLD